MRICISFQILRFLSNIIYLFTHNERLKIYFLLFWRILSLIRVINGLKPFFRKITSKISCIAANWFIKLSSLFKCRLCVECWRLLLSVICSFCLLFSIVIRCVFPWRLSTTKCRVRRRSAWMNLRRLHRLLELRVLAKHLAPNQANAKQRSSTLRFFWKPFFKKD